MVGLSRAGVGGVVSGGKLWPGSAGRGTVRRQEDVLLQVLRVDVDGDVFDGGEEVLEHLCVECGVVVEAERAAAVDEMTLERLGEKQRPEVVRALLLRPEEEAGENGGPVSPDATACQALDLRDGLIAKVGVEVVALRRVGETRVGNGGVEN